MCPLPYRLREFSRVFYVQTEVAFSDDLMIGVPGTPDFGVLGWWRPDEPVASRIESAKSQRQLHQASITAQSFPAIWLARFVSCFSAPGVK